MDLVEITADARSDFHGLRRFESPDVFVPLNNLAGDWLDNGHDRRRGGLWGWFPAARQQQSSQERSNSEQGVRLHGKHGCFIFCRQTILILRLSNSSCRTMKFGPLTFQF